MRKKLLGAAALLVLTVIAASAQRTPTFAAYAVKVEKVRNISVDLKSNKGAREFRTMLREAAKGGINFAGHYVMAGWGCGTNCEVLAVIDARNGHVYFPKELEGVGIGFLDLPPGPVATDAPEENEYQSGAYYKASSRLFALQGFTGGGLDDKNAKCGTYYFEWTGNRLRKVAFVAGKRTDTP